MFDSGPVLTRLRPGEGQEQDFAATLRFAQVLQCFEQDPPLKFAVVRHAEVVPHHERYEHSTRRLRVLRHIQSNRKRNRGYPSAFNGALHERDGLVSYRSGRAQQSDVGSVGDDRIRYLFAQRTLQSLRVHIIADKGEEVGRQSTDHTLGY